MKTFQCSRAMFVSFNQDDEICFICELSIAIMPHYKMYLDAYSPILPTPVSPY